LKGDVIFLALVGVLIQKIIAKIFELYFKFTKTNLILRHK